MLRGSTASRRGAGALHVGALAALFPMSFSRLSPDRYVRPGVRDERNRYFVRLSSLVDASKPPRTPSHRNVTALLGTLALQGGPISWVSTHRVHHAHSDQEDDPHHPALPALPGPISSGCFFPKPTAEKHAAEYDRASTDLTADPYYVFLDAISCSCSWLALLLCAFGGWSWIIWGIFVRSCWSTTSHGL